MSRLGRLPMFPMIFLFVESQDSLLKSKEKQLVTTRCPNDTHHIPQ